MRRNLSGLAAVVFVAHVHACASIEPIAPDTCGNHVVDEGEDCDGFSRLGMSCRASAEEGQCRFDCSESPDACLAPYGCGADLICRAPRGELELGSESDEDAALLFARDFDDDGFQDLLIESSGGNVLTYRTEDFDVDLDVDLVGLGLDEQGTVAELTGDELADIVVASKAGVGVMRGGGDRTLLGTAYAGFPIPDVQHVVITALDAVTDSQGHEPVAVIQFPEAILGGPTFVLLVDPVSLTDEIFLLSELGTLPDLVVDGEEPLDAVPTGQLDPATPCDEYVLAFRAQDQVLVGTPCDQDDLVNGGVFDGPVNPPVPQVPPLAVDLSACGPPGTPFSVDRAFVLDVDEDGQRDVFIVPEVALGTPPAPACVVFGPLTFLDPTAMTPAGPAIAQPFPAITVAAGERALEVKHINGDGEPDLVTTAGVFVTQPTCPPTLTRSPGGPSSPLCNATPEGLGALASVAIGDLNADAILDLALADGLTDRALAQIGHADGTFSSFPVFTDGFPSHLAMGDFDGDGVDDLASAARSCVETTCAAPDVLEVVFGRVAEGPEEPRTIGRLGRIEQFQVGKLSSASGFDGTTDLGVLFTDLEDPTKASFATLFGSTQRQLEAPFVISGGAANPTEAKPLGTLSAVAGHFAERDGESGPYQPSGEAPERMDIAAVTYAPGDPDPRDDVRFWLLAVEGEAELSDARTWASEPLSVPWDEWSPFLSCSLVADLDGDPASELVYLAGKGFVVADVASTSAGNPAFAPAYVETDETFISTRWLDVYPQDAVPDFVVDAAVPAILEDIDGSGFRDLVALGYLDGKQVLVVYWNDAGQLSASPDARSVAQLSSPAHALVAIHLDGDPELEIVLADDAGGSVVQVALTLGPDGPPSRSLVVPAALFEADEELNPARAVAAADFDGDGVVDLAFGYAGATRLYRSGPVIE